MSNYYIVHRDTCKCWHVLVKCLHEVSVLSDFSGIQELEALYRNMTGNRTFVYVNNFIKLWYHEKQNFSSYQ